jgi:hypothetical protein
MLFIDSSYALDHVGTRSGQPLAAGRAPGSIRLDGQANKTVYYEVVFE